MILSPADRQTIEAELRRAIEALGQGNDGKARVCARRASGVALRAWFQARGSGATGPGDAQSLLKLAGGDPGLPQEIRQAAIRLSTAITERDRLPFSDDPVTDARAIVGAIESLPPDRRDV